MEFLLRRKYGVGNSQLLYTQYQPDKVQDGLLGQQLDAYQGQCCVHGLDIVHSVIGQLQAFVYGYVNILGVFANKYCIAARTFLQAYFRFRNINPVNKINRHYLLAIVSNIVDLLYNLRSFRELGCVIMPVQKRVQYTQNDKTNFIFGGG